MSHIHKRPAVVRADPGGNVGPVVLSKKLRVVALGLALILAAAACGSSSKKSGGNNNSGAPTTVGVSGEDNGPGVRGGSLTYALEADTTGGWCLYKAQLAISGIQVARAIYDTLTMPGADGKIHPFLAQAVTPNADYTQWTIKVRPGITFTDGSPLNAQVVADNLDHYRKQNQLFIFVFSDVTDVKVADAMTVVVTTKRPWVAFPWFLWSSSRLGIMAEAQMNSQDCNTKLIGTGPFEKVSWTPGDRFVAKRNPNYWVKDSKGVQLPYLDQITFVPVENGPARTQGLEAGDYTAIDTDSALQIVKIRKDIQNGSLKDTESDKFAEVGYTMLNATKPPFDHLSARQAFAYAIDRDTVNQLRNNGILQNASGPFAPGSQGYVKDTGLPDHADPAKAKAAAAQYKQETGKTLSFTLYTSSDPETLETAKLLQQMLLANAGVHISLNPVADQSTYINDAIGRLPEAILWRNHPGADDDTQYVWWHCSNTPPAPCDNPVNFGGFNDDVINKAFDDARTTPDEAKREADYETINKQFAKQLYDLWGQWVLWIVAYKPTVHGVFGPPLPDGAAPFNGLATGHSFAGMWCTNGKC